MKTTITAITTLALTLGALTACSVTDQDPTPSPTMAATPSMSTPSFSPSPSFTRSESPSPTATATLDTDQRAAQSIVDEFFRISNELQQKPELPLQPLADITTGQTQALQLKAIADFRKMNAVQVGDLRWSVLNVGPSATQGNDQVVVVEACTDSTALDVIDQDTNESVLPDDRTPVLRWTITTVAENGYWRVGDVTNKSVEECSS